MRASHLLLLLSLAGLGVGQSTFGQQPNRPPEKVRPPLLFRETWKEAPDSGIGHATPEAARLEDESKRVTQNSLTNPNLEVKLYGLDSINVTVYKHEGRPDIWTGVANSPVALTLRYKNGYLDLTGLARLRWITRTQSLHIVHPVVKLADGTLLVGSHGISTEGAYLENEVDFSNQSWFKLDPVKVIPIGLVKNPDLSKVDEIGFADLMPSGGHYNAGWVNVSALEVYANTHPRQ
jgi:hypothetical protein